MHISCPILSREVEELILIFHLGLNIRCGNTSILDVILKNKQTKRKDFSVRHFTTAKCYA